MSAPDDVIAGRARWCVVEGDAAEVVATLPAATVDLAWVDPPYYRVVDQPWDRAWRTHDDYLQWVDRLVAGLARALAPGGSLYLFASPQMAARVEVIVGAHLRVLNHIVWAKAEGVYLRTCRAEQRSYATQTERVIVAEPRGPLGGATLGDAIRAARQAAGLSQDDLDIAVGRVRRRDPSKGSGLIRLQEAGERTPNADDFCAVLRACGDRRGAAELDALYLSLLRPFTLPEGAPNTDVWTYSTVASYPGKHPCEKPGKMLRDVVETATRPGAVVLDPFGGSFRMASAALDAGRRYIGSDFDARWCAQGRTLANHAAPTAADLARKVAEPIAAPRADFGPLFGGTQ